MAQDSRTDSTGEQQNDGPSTGRVILVAGLIGILFLGALFAVLGGMIFALWQSINPTHFDSAESVQMQVKGGVDDTVRYAFEGSPYWATYVQAMRDAGQTGPLIKAEAESEDLVNAAYTGGDYMPGEIRISLTLTDLTTDQVIAKTSFNESLPMVVADTGGSAQEAAFNATRPKANARLEEAIRDAAFDAMAMHPEHEAVFLPSMADAMLHDEEASGPAAMQIGIFGDNALPAIVALAQSGEAMRAGNAVGKLQGHTVAVAGDLLTLHNLGDEYLARRTIKAMAPLAIEHEGARDAVVAALASPDKATRHDAMAAIASQAGKFPESRAAIETALQDSDETVRELAIKAAVLARDVQALQNALQQAPSQLDDGIEEAGKDASFQPTAVLALLAETLHGAPDAAAAPLHEGFKDLLRKNESAGIELLSHTSRKVREPVAVELIQAQGHVPAVRAAVVAAMKRTSDADEACAIARAIAQRHTDDATLAAAVTVLASSAQAEDRLLALDKVRHIREALTDEARQRLAALASDSDPQVAGKAAEQLGQFVDDPAARNAMRLEAMATVDADKRQDLIRQLVKPVSQLSRLLALAYDADAKRMLLSRNDLRRIAEPAPDEAMPLARLVLEHPNDEARGMALDCLEQLGEDAAPAAKLLDTLMIDPDEERLALSATGVYRAIGGPIGARGLALYAARNPASIPQSTWLALRDIGNEAVPPLLEVAAEHPALAERLSDLLKRMKVEGEPVRAMMRPLLDSPSEPLQQVAALYLAEHGEVTAASLPGLRRALHSGQEDVAETAARAVGTLKTAANDLLPDMVAALRHQKLGWGERDPIYQALISMGPPKASHADALINHLDSDHLTVQLGAIRLLEQLGNDASTASPKLIAILKDAEHKDLRVAALNALPAVGAAPAHVMPIITPLVEAQLNAENPTRDDLAEASLAYAAKVGEPGLPVVVASATARQWWMSRPAKEALTASGKAAVRPVLQQLAATDNADAQLKLVEILEGIGPDAKQAVPALERLATQAQAQENLRLKYAAERAVRAIQKTP